MKENISFPLCYHATAFCFILNIVHFLVTEVTELLLLVLNAGFPCPNQWSPGLHRRKEANGERSVQAESLVLFPFIRVRFFFPFKPSSQLLLFCEIWLCTSIHSHSFVHFAAPRRLNDTRSDRPYRGDGIRGRGSYSGRNPGRGSSHDTRERDGNRGGRGSGPARGGYSTSNNGGAPANSERRSEGQRAPRRVPNGPASRSNVTPPVAAA